MVVVEAVVVVGRYSTRWRRRLDGLPLFGSCSARIAWIELWTPPVMLHPRTAPFYVWQFLRRLVATRSVRYIYTCTLPGHVLGLCTCFDVLSLLYYMCIVSNVLAALLCFDVQETRILPKPQTPFACCAIHRLLTGEDMDNLRAWTLHNHYN